jgi:membrane-associated phospholipid phosphatase
MTTSGREKMTRRLNLLDFLTAAFITIIILLLILFYPRFPHGWRTLLGYIILLLLVLFISYARQKWREIKIVRALCDLSPVFFILAVFELLGGITPYLRPDIDSLLIKADLALFGVHPTVWMEDFFIPWVADILALAYISYYFIPLILILILYFKGRSNEFFLTAGTLLLGYYICYIIYIFMPAVGPRFTLASLQQIPLNGGIIMNTIVDTLNALEGNKRDCFPSGHTQIVLVSLWFAFKYRRPLFWIYLPIIIALIISTVYLRYHYVIDLVAGIAAAGITILLGQFLWSWWADQRGD